MGVSEVLKLFMIIFFIIPVFTISLSICNANDIIMDQSVGKFDFTGYPPPGPIQKYKGKLLVGSSYPDIKNGSFFSNIKLAIDLTETLPKKLRRDIAQIKIIMYDPPSKHRKNNGAHTNTTGVYTIGPNLFQAAPVIIHRDTKWIAAVNIAYSLVGGSVAARRHNMMIDLKKKIDSANSKNSPEIIAAKRMFNEIMASFTKSNQAIVDKYKCAPALAEFEAKKIWEKDPVKRDGFAKMLSTRGCL